MACNGVQHEEETEYVRRKKSNLSSRQFPKIAKGLGGKRDEVMQVFEKCTFDRGRSKEDCFEGIVSHGVAENETDGLQKGGETKGRCRG